ncbi:MAG TPA: glycosyltransferase [Phycisphaerales bacterium]|nr:glycosyltransferase [Phycisphaerales bacterium]
MVEKAPVISVVMPTYKRHELLRRAIASVRAQTFTDWELIISDDERPAGAAFAETTAIAAQDPRVRIVQNPNKPGQASNLNYACSLARGQWIKPLYDDDAFQPECLAEFYAVAQRVPSAALIICGVDRYLDGALRAKGRVGAVPVRTLQQNAVHLAMYMQDADLGTPIQAMIPRRVFFEHGVRFPESKTIISNVDTLWKADVLVHGDLVEILKPLVNQHQGSHETITAKMTTQMLFQEFYELRSYFWDRIPADVRAAGFVDVRTESGSQRVKVPPMRVAQGMQELVYAAVLAKKRQLLSAGLKVLSVPSVSAWSHFLRWARHQRDPGSHDYVPRLPLRA